MEENIKVAFLDRDGTISYEYEDEVWKDKLVPEFYADTIKFLKYITKVGYKIIIITNQPLIAKKIITYENYQIFTNNLVNMLKNEGIEVLDIFYCPHTSKDNCNCKKPKPGMIEKALTKYNIDLKNSFLVGDRESDGMLAKYYNLLFYALRFDFDYQKCIKVNSLNEIINVMEGKNNE